MKFLPLDVNVGMGLRLKILHSEALTCYLLCMGGVFAKNAFCGVCKIFSLCLSTFPKEAFPKRGGSFFRDRLSIHDGPVTHKAVAEAIQLSYVPASEALKG